jgi:hypothetical protein
MGRVIAIGLNQQQTQTHYCCPSGWPEVVAMGAWSPALFADDDAADLRADYRTYLADAQSDAGATDLAARDYDASLDRPGETTAFWLALASIQWRIGRLDPRVKSVCLAIIDNEIDLSPRNSPLKWTLQNRHGFTQSGAVACSEPPRTKAWRTTRGRLPSATARFASYSSSTSM